MRAGIMRHKFDLYQSTNERDEFGAKTETTKRLGTFACSVDVESNETLDGSVKQAQTMARFKTRYNQQLDNINNDMYIQFQGKEWDIKSVINVGYLNKEMVVTALLRGL